MSDNSGYISNADNGHGSTNCPVLITAQPGQIINFTVIDTDPEPALDNCQPVGSIKDIINKQETTICKSKKREQHVYLSSGPQVQITLDEAVAGHDFLLHYEGEIYNVITIDFEH